MKKVSHNFFLKALSELFKTLFLLFSFSFLLGEAKSDLEKPKKDRPKQQLIDSFSRQSETFNIQVALAKNKLSISLWDYKHQLVFRGQYAQSDIGQSINRKFELSDVVNSVRCGINNIHKSAKESMIQFGTLRKFENQPCFKIEEGGILTLQDKLQIQYKKLKVGYEQSNQQFKKQTQKNEELQNKIDELLKNKNGQINDLSAQVLSLQQKNTVLQAKQKELETQLLALEQQNAQMSKVFQRLLEFVQ